MFHTVSDFCFLQAGAKFKRKKDVCIMATTDIILLVVFTLAAIVGLVITILQKKGILKPAKQAQNNHMSITNGSAIMIIAGLLGMMIIAKYSMPLAFLYEVVVLGAFMLVQILVHESGRK